MSAAARIWWITDTVAGSPNPTPADLADLRSEGFSMVVCLLDEGGPPGYDPSAAGDLGYAFHHLPIADFQAPTAAQFRAFVDIAGGATADAAITEIRARLPGAIQSAIQQRSLAALATERAAP